MMNSNITGVFVHVFSSSDDRKMDATTKQRTKLREMLDIATNHLKDCHYNQAKTNFVEAKTYLKNCKKRDEMNLPDELDFYINIVICYSFTMELDNVKDVTKEEFKKEDNNMRSEIDGLVKKYSKRHFPLFLRLLYSFKKESWREAIYYCELVHNFQVCPEEEKKYKSTPIFSKHLIPELDIDYCNDVVHNIEEAAIYGLIENMAKLDELKNPKASLSGFNWVNLWSKECNEKIIKRLRSYKKPMNSLQLHKLFHSEILPNFYSLNKSNIGKSLFCYYKKEFMYQCEECLRAKLQQESRNELFGRLGDHSSNDNYSDDTDYFDTDDEDDDDDLPDSHTDDTLVAPLNLSKLDEKGKEKSSDGKDKTSEMDKEEKNIGEGQDKTEEETGKEKLGKPKTKKTSKSQQTQTDKMKIVHRYVQTEWSIKKKSIAIQTDLPKTKKQEKVEKQEETKSSKCTNNTELLTGLDEIKKQLSECKFEIKESVQDQLIALQEQIREENSNTKNQNEKVVDKNFEIRQTKENIAKLEKQILIMQETFDKEKKDLSEKNIFLQKLLIDQINDKYMLYKNVYSGLENNCRVIIANVTELQNFLTMSSVPNAKDNESYLSRWEKTLSDLQNKNGQLKSYYKKAKSRMLHLSQYEFSDWPDIAEIPIEAFGFLFDSLKQNVKNVGLIANHQNLQNQKPAMQNQPVQMPGGQMYPVQVMQPNIRPYIGTALRYGTYQPPPPPIPMPPPKSQNVQFPTWSHSNSNPNAQMYPTNNQWNNNPNMAAFLKTFPNTAENDGNNQKPVNGPNFRKSTKLQHQEGQNNPPENMRRLWNMDNIDSCLNKNNETSRSLNPNATAYPVEQPVNQQENIDMNDYFTAYNNFKTVDSSNSNNHAPNLSHQASRVQNVNSVSQTAVSEQNLIKNGFWAVDNPSKSYCDVSKQTKDQSKNTKHGTADSQQVSSNQDSENEFKSGTSSSMENLSGKVIHRPVRPLPKLVNVCKDEDSDFDAEKELFQYLKTNCSDVDNDELISNILKILKKYDGSFSNVPKTDILKEVRSSILTTKHGVWISPKSPLVDWENDHADSHCSICFDDLTQRPKRVLPCKHEYHKDCISQWLRTNSICPICRVHSVIDEEYPPLS